MADHLQGHIRNNNLSNIFQSAFRVYNFTESALLKVTHNSDIMIVSLDNAALDTIDHTTLTNRLSL